jgi:hypothetical protein
MEEAESGSLNVLDLCIRVTDSGLVVGFYRKTARSDIFLNAKSALPQTQKYQIILNERERILKRCQTDKEKVDEMGKFDQRLKRNGFSDEQLKQIRKKTRRRSQGELSPVNNLGSFFFSVPFVSDSINGRIRKMFKRAGVNVILVHKGRSLKNILQKNTPERKCKIPNCPTPKHICFRHNVVYKMECVGCKATYIGMTTRSLHLRVREHLTRRSSSVKQHETVCGSQWDVKVIASARSITELQIKEALLINEQKPCLNNRNEAASLPIV